MQKLLTAIEPEEEGLLRGLVLGLEEPVEERLVGAYFYVAGVVAEVNRRLARQGHHSVVGAPAL